MAFDIYNLIFNRKISIHQKIVFACCLSLFGFLNVYAQNPNVISHDIRVVDIEEKKFPVFVMVRNQISDGHLQFHAKPDFESPVLYRLPAKSIFHFSLSFDEMISRENNERNNQGAWRKFQFNENEVLYFYDHWKSLSTFYSTSRGISLTPRKNIGEHLVLYSEIPSQLDKNPCEPKNQEIEIESQPETQNCLKITEIKNQMYLIESKFVSVFNSSGEAQRQLFYHVRFVKSDLIETTERKAWILARQLQILDDAFACHKEVCLNSALLANQPEDVQNLFFDMGYVKRPTEEKQQIDLQFYAMKKFNASADGKTQTYNRWIDRMHKEVKNKKELDPVGYILGIRPVWFLGGGHSEYEFEQRGSDGKLQFNSSGPTLVGGLVFPVFLDLELIIRGHYLHSSNFNSKQVKDAFDPLEITNDVILTFPSHKWRLSYFTGVGITFRSLLQRANNVGYNVMYSGHGIAGMYIGDWTLYTHAGATAVDVTASLSHPEWHMALGKNLAYTKLGAWSAWFHYSGHEAEIRERDALTGEVRVTNYQSKKMTASVQLEF